MAERRCRAGSRCPEALERMHILRAERPPDLLSSPNFPSAGPRQGQPSQREARIIDSTSRRASGWPFVGSSADTRSVEVAGARVALILVAICAIRRSIRDGHAARQMRWRRLRIPDLAGRLNGRKNVAWSRGTLACNRMGLPRAPVELQVEFPLQPSTPVGLRPLKPFLSSSVQPDSDPRSRNRRRSRYSHQRRK